jgi:hypothetical protein
MEHLPSVVDVLPLISALPQ